MNPTLQRTLLIALAVVCVGLAAYYVWSNFGEDEVIRSANTRTLMDSETGELFDFEITPDFAPYPHKNPKTGTMTLYPTEVCWKGECLEKGGTHVIMNRWLGKEGPTRCPVCGSVVRDHNPGPPTKTDK